MKKRLCILLILALALAAVPAFAAEGDAILGKDEDGGSMYFNYAFAQGDTAWFVTGGTTLYAWRAGDADLTECTVAMPEREAGENLSDDLSPFCVDGQLYALDLVTSYEEDAQFVGAVLYRLTGDGPEFTPEKVGDVDWSDLTEYYDQNSYPTRPDGLIGLPGKAAFRAYDSTGDFRGYTLDVASCRLECLEEIQNLAGLSNYRDGALLVCQYSYDQPEMCRLSVYDAADESLQPLAEITVPQYSPLSGMAYDAESDAIYCIKGGEICRVDLQAGEIGEGVTDMPLEVYGNSQAFVLPGGYYIACGDGAAVRNLDPGQRAEVRLKINDSGWNDCVNTAYYRYSNTHGEVSCILSHDWTESQNLLESMMNRDDSIDVYVLSTSSPIYDALYRRGYLMELDGSEALSAFADSLYPDIRDALSTNGRLVAIPVSINAWTPGVNEKALEKLGMTIADVPDNWMDFLDFLVSLEEPLKAGKIHLFYDGYTTEDAQNDMFYAIFETYQRYVNAVDPAMGYNTDLLRTLLTKLESIDFAALGLPEPVEDDENGRAYSGDVSEDSILLQTGVGCTIGEFYSEYTPILMGLDANTPVPLVLNADVAFVNPFTKYPEQAIAFMETLTQSLSTGVRYDINPDLNEVIRGKQNEDSLREAQKWVDDTRAQLDEADEADRQMLEEMLTQAEENLHYWENYGWEVSQRDLDWYRGHDDKLLLAGVQWIYADESGEGWQLISQYRDHQISLDEMLAGIDRKVQMMLMEGN